MARRVSLCLIVKNEEATLAACLQSAAGLVHECVVVDTGSTDRTREIAAGLGARVFDFAWVDSFAAARNASLEPATGDWILWLDGDEYFDGENRAKLRALFDQLGDEPAAYILRQRSASEIPGEPPALVDQCRLFRNHPQIRWSYRVHEQILPAVNASGMRSGSPTSASTTPAIPTRRYAGASRSATCGCYTWKRPSSPTTRLRCSTWAGPTWSNSSPAAPFPTCAAAWSGAGMGIRSCGSCSFCCR